MKFLILMSVLYLSCHSYAANSCRIFSKASGPFVQVKQSDNLSQLIRSNTYHYWGWMREATGQDLRIQPWLEYQGLVMGDPHLGNFSPVLVSKKNGKEAIELRVVDFDDIGRGPLVIDLARMIVATEAIDSSVKKSDLVTAYIEGLKNPEGQWAGKIPKELEKALELTVEDYKKKYQDYVEKKTSEGKDFKLEKGEMEAYKGEMLEPVLSYFGRDRVLSVAEKIVERGGSKNALRLWVLLRKGENLQILELKEWQPSGLEAYAAQSSMRDILPQLYEYFWPGLTPQGYELVTINGQQFWLREKMLSLIDIPYNVNSKSEEKFISEYGQVSAFLLGKVHGRQAAGQSLLKYIESYRGDGMEQLKEVIEPYIREYLDVAEAELK